MKNALAFRMELHTYKKSLHVIVLLLLALSARECSAVAKKKLTVGLFVPWTGSWPVGTRLASAAPIAIDEINNNTALLPDHELQFIWSDCGCSKVMSAGGTVEFVKKNISVIIGPYCSKGCVPSGLIAGYYNVPMITYSCSTSELSKKSEYPTTARTFAYARTNEIVLFDNTVKMIKHFGWKMFTIITELSSPWSEIGTRFLRDGYKQGLTVREIRFNPNDVDYYDASNAAGNKKAEDYRKNVLDSAKLRGRSMNFFSYFSFLTSPLLVGGGTPVVIPYVFSTRGAGVALALKKWNEKVVELMAGGRPKDFYVVFA